MVSIRLSEKLSFINNLLGSFIRTEISKSITELSSCCYFSFIAAEISESTLELGDCHCWSFVAAEISESTLEPGNRHCWSFVATEISESTLKPGNFCWCCSPKIHQQNFIKYLPRKRLKEKSRIQTKK